MKKSRKGLGIGGAGLQSANLDLARRRKRRGFAYAWWLLFPIGAHRLYLNDSRAWFYPAATLVALLLALLHFTTAWVVAGGIAAAALYDLLWIDRRVNELNKQIRMEIYLRPGVHVPRGFRGRFADGNETGLADDEDKQGERPKSFSDQEALLHKLAKSARSKDAKKGDE